MSPEDRATLEGCIAAKVDLKEARAELARVRGQRDKALMLLKDMDWPSHLGNAIDALLRDVASEAAP